MERKFSVKIYREQEIIVTLDESVVNDDEDWSDVAYDIAVCYIDGDRFAERCEMVLDDQDTSIDEVK